MKKVLQFIIIFILTIIYVSAQQKTFSKVLYSNGAIQIHSLTPSTYGDLLFTGKYNYSDGLAALFDSSGKVIWNKIFTNYTSTHSPSLNFSKLINTSDSNFLIVGDAYDEILQKTSAICIKLNSIGDTIWSTSITHDDTVYHDDYIYINSVCNTNDSGYLLVGYILKWKSGTFLPYLVKIDNKGFIKWTKILSHETEMFYGFSVKQAMNDEFIVLLNNRSSKTTVILKIDKNGELLWSKEYYIKNSTICTSNDFLITQNEIIIYVSTFDGVALLGLDNSGTFLWSNFFQVELPYYSEIPSSILRISNNYFLIVCGSWDNGKLLKLDSDGNLIYAKKIELNPTGIVETANKEYLIYGNGPLTGLKKTGNDESFIGLIQIDSTGNNQDCVYSIDINPIEDLIIIDTVKFFTFSGGVNNFIPLNIYTSDFFSETRCMNIIDGLGEKLKNPDMLIYPNPSSGLFTLTNIIIQTGQIFVFNTNGQIVLISDININKPIIDLSLEPSGLFYYQIVAKNRIINSGKLIKI